MSKLSLSLPKELGTRNDSEDGSLGSSGNNRATRRLVIDIETIDGFPLYDSRPALGRRPKILRWFACWAGKR